jgi:hypothetical protein
LQDPPKFTQIWIFGLKTNHLATLGGMFIASLISHFYGRASPFVPCRPKTFLSFSRKQDVKHFVILPFCHFVILRVLQQAERTLIRILGIVPKQIISTNSFFSTKTTLPSA